MFKTSKYFVFAILVLFCCAPLLYADLSKAEEREVNAYRLTKPKINDFWNATKNLLAAYQKDPKLFHSLEEKDDNNENKSSEQGTLENMIRATNNIPAAKKAIEDAGMTAKEYWTFQMAMIYAGTGEMVLKSGGKLPEGFSKENIDFYRTHHAEFMKLDKDIKALNEISNRKSSASDKAEEEETEEPE